MNYSGDRSQVAEIERLAVYDCRSKQALPHCVSNSMASTMLQEQVAIDRTQLITSGAVAIPVITLLVIAVCRIAKIRIGFAERRTQYRTRR